MIDFILTAWQTPHIQMTALQDLAVIGPIVLPIVGVCIFLAWRNNK